VDFVGYGISALAVVVGRARVTIGIARQIPIGFLELVAGARWHYDGYDGIGGGGVGTRQAIGVLPIRHHRGIRRLVSAFFARRDKVAFPEVEVVASVAAPTVIVMGCAGSRR